MAMRACAQTQRFLRVAYIPEICATSESWLSTEILVNFSSKISTATRKETNNGCGEEVQEAANVSADIMAFL